MTPEAFLAGYPAHIQELAHQLRAVVKQAVPNVSEQVYRGWRLIGYRVATPERRRKRGAYFCYIAPGDEALQLGFEYGILLVDPRGLLEGEGKQVRYVTIAAAADLARQGLPDLIAEGARVAILPKEEKAALKFELEEIRQLDNGRERS
jgi:hypothetical protein